MKPAQGAAHAVCRLPRWDAGVPLWQLVPKQDESGRHCTDFMMLAPGLNKRSAREVRDAMLIIQAVLDDYGRWVMFADFNLKLNLLWVSLRHQPGVMSQIASVLHARLPMLKLVGHHAEVGK